ncbi:MAG TPA: hypothetical protein VI759_04710 [Dehalococcoidia bacterium]|nr:hypothetical protein [Dehalococcoidia bacterium]
MTEIEPPSAKAESEKATAAEPEAPTAAEENARDEQDWHNGHGESPDTSALRALQLAHSAVQKFPELTRRYQKFIGTAAVVSSAIIVLASIAVARRQAKGETAEKILSEITPEEIESAGRQKPKKPEKDAKKGRFQH